MASERKTRRLRVRCLWHTVRRAFRDRTPSRRLRARRRSPVGALAHQAARIFLDADAGRTLRGFLDFDAARARFCAGAFSLRCPRRSARTCSTPISRSKRSRIPRPALPPSKAAARAPRSSPTDRLACCQAAVAAAKIDRFRMRSGRWMRSGATSRSASLCDGDRDAACDGRRDRLRVLEPLGCDGRRRIRLFGYLGEPRQHAGGVSGCSSHARPSAASRLCRHSRFNPLLRSLREASR